MSDIASVIEAQGPSPIASIDFRGDPRFSLQALQYQTQPFVADRRVPRKIHYSPSLAPYGILLEVEERNIRHELAVLGFDVIEGGKVLECRQIQGGPGCYRPLTCVSWEQALLRAFVNLGIVIGAREVTVLPSHRVLTGENLKAANTEAEVEHLQRLDRRYNANARRAGFQYEEDSERYVMSVARTVDLVPQ